MKLLQKHEAESLSNLLVEKVQASAAMPGTPPELRERALSEFVRYRFDAPLRANGRAAPWYGRAFTYISVATIAAGLASSAIAEASDDPPTTLIAILGLAIGVLTAINQLWRPAQRSVARYQAAYALRREAWEFIHDRGRYERIDPDKRLGLFLDEVNRAQRGVEAIDEAAAQSTPSASE